MSSPIDFMPDWGGDKIHQQPKQSVSQMKEFLIGLAATHNKRMAQQSKFPRLKPNKY
jgi:hypothetical protein